MNIELDDSTVSAVQWDVDTASSNSTNAQDENFKSDETKKATDEKLKTFIAYTQIESFKHVTKKFWLTTDGKLEQKTAASVHTGQMKVVHCADVFAFAESLTNLSTHQCLVFGVPPRDAFLTTKEDWVKRGCPDDPLPRSKEVMSWSNGPGVLLLDYDAPKNGDAPLERDELLALLFKACTKADGKD